MKVLKGLACAVLVLTALVSASDTKPSEDDSDDSQETSLTLNTASAVQSSFNPAASEFYPPLEQPSFPAPTHFAPQSLFYEHYPQLHPPIPAPWLGFGPPPFPAYYPPPGWAPPIPASFHRDGPSPFSVHYPPPPFPAHYPQLHSPVPAPFHEFGPPPFPACYPPLGWPPFPLPFHRDGPSSFPVHYPPPFLAPYPGIFNPPVPAPFHRFGPPPFRAQESTLRDLNDEVFSFSVAAKLCLPSDLWDDLNCIACRYSCFYSMQI